jgi:hypothetical protein
MLEGDKKPVEKNYKPKAKVAKNGISGYENRNVWFF